MARRILATVGHYAAVAALAYVVIAGTSVAVVI